MELALVGLFCLVYICIIFEHPLKLNKTAVALLGGTIAWAYLLESRPADAHLLTGQLIHHLADVSQILLFLMGTMTIVEVINSHDGFELVGRLFEGRSLRFTYWALLLSAFFASAVLDNLTTLLVWVCLLRRLVPDTKHRVLLGAGLVTAVNAGGAWTPIGDVTTTMLWIQERITTTQIVQSLFLPSLVSIIVFGLLFWPTVRRAGVVLVEPSDHTNHVTGRIAVLTLGLCSLIAVPLLKVLYELPPFMGVMLGVGLLWVVTDLIHGEKKDREHLKVYRLLGHVDWACILFFFGILFMVNALESAGILEAFSLWLNQHVQSETLIATVIGLASALVDNVPLVALAMKMYASAFGLDHSFWHALAYTAGTGGSILIIGSAPGVALMALERVGFGWYARKVGWAALLSYFAGLVVLVCV